MNSSHACSGVTTDLGILSYLVKLLQRVGIEEICIGESSLEDTGQVLRAPGVAELENMGGRVINFDALMAGSPSNRRFAWPCRDSA